jgi:hypothetical protein
MAYTKQTWTDNSPSTPVNAARLGHMEDGIETANALPRGELGYAERQTSDTTTNTVFGSINSNLISTLSLVVVGSGRAVEIEYQGSVYHSVANTYVGIGICVDGTMVRYAGVSSPSTTTGRTFLAKHRMVLVDQQSYTITIGKYIGAAGTGNYYGDGLGSPQHLVVVER